MSPPTDHSQDHDAPSERAIADALEQSAAAPSAAHDARILAAAKAITEQSREQPGQPAEPSANTESSSARSPARRATRRWPVALAAGLVATIGALFLVTLPEPIDDRVRSSVTVKPANEAVLDHWPKRMSWPASAPGSRYRLLMLDADGTVLWESAPLTVPYWESTRAPIAAAEGETVRWAVRIDGPQRQELGPFRFSLQP